MAAATATSLLLLVSIRGLTAPANLPDLGREGFVLVFEILASLLAGGLRLFLDGEGLCDVNTALDLLARHIVDQRASNLLFGDRRRLQEDLLADAANAEVRKLLPKARGCPSGAHRRAR